MCRAVQALTVYEKQYVRISGLCSAGFAPACLQRASGQDSAGNCAMVCVRLWGPFRGQSYRFFFSKRLSGRSSSRKACESRRGRALWQWRPALCLRLWTRFAGGNYAFFLKKLFATPSACSIRSCRFRQTSCSERMHLQICGTSLVQHGLHV